MRNRGRLLASIAVALFSAGTCVSAAQEITLYSFKGSSSSDGSGPECNLIFDAAGNLYGTTSSGGGVGAPFDTYGTAFELVAGTGGTWTEKVLYSFGSAAGDGIQSLSGLVFDASGNLYGTTNLGGAYSGGTVYELSPGTGGVWTEKVLYSFGATSGDGTEPRRGSLIFDSHGNLYGTTLLGGGNTVSNGGGVETAGTVFELSPGTGGVWTEKVLYSFGATATDAANPVDGLVFDAAGNLYGTTKYGGTSNDGTAFELSPGSEGTWTENVIHSFADNGTDGSIPESGLTFDNQGNLYGTTYGGGINPYSGGLGAVFELSPAGGGNWSEQVIYSFNSAVGVGDYPLGGVIFDAAGNLYGTASSGLYAYGQVYELSPTASGWKETTLYKFGAAPDGYAPYNGLVFDTQGNLYGTDSTGGAEAADFGLGGTVYEIPSVTTASPTFSPGTGAYSGTQMVKIMDATPDAAIYYSINGGPGTLYSTQIEVSESETIQAYATTTTLPQSQVATASYQIGTTAAAPVFSIPAGTYTIAQSVALTDVAPGATIYYTTTGLPPSTSSTKYTGPITVSSTETIEAFAVAAGYANSPVVSAAYTITPFTLPAEDVIYDFLPPADQGASQPQSSLISDAAGNLYGTTQAAGANGYGSVFELMPPTGGGQWTQKILYSFTGTPDGQAPLAGLIFDAKGNLYGTTSAGGTWDSGTAFELTPATSGPWTETIIHHFDYLTNDGTTPMAGLIFDGSGNLYGTTSGGGAYSSNNANPGGTVFELTPGMGGVWTENILHSFDYLNQSDGYYPLAGVAFDTHGNLYGTTSDGGAGQDSEGGGTVFELSPAGGGTWTETVMHTFGGCAEFCTDGFLPKSTPVIDAAGNVYGTTSTGGPNDFGTGGMVFELSPAGGGTWTETVAHNFGAYETDGTRPLAGMIIDVSGNLYGTTYSGGMYGSGTVFELSPETSGPWKESVLHHFNNDGTDGANPYAALLLTTSGKLFGAAFAGGASGDGIAFEFATGQTEIGAPTVLTSPTPSSTLAGGPVTFGWTPGDGATGYALWIGSTGPGSDNLYYSGEKASTVTSLVVSGLPVNGETIYVRLITYYGTADTFNSYTYTSATGGILTTPAPSSTLPGPSVTFGWTAGAGATGYGLWVGSTGAGSDNLYYSGERASTVTSLTVSNLPTNGETIYVRLVTYYGSSSAFINYTYAAATAAVLTTPTPDSTLASPSVTFSWTAAANATGYALWAGTTGTGSGSDNLYYSGEKASTVTSLVVSGLPVNGEAIYMRLITYYGSASTYTTYTYTSATGGILTTPTPSSTLAGPSVTFGWTAGTGATGYALWIGSTGAGSDNLYYSGEKASTVTSLAVSGLPTNGETIYVRLITYYGSSSAYINYTYTAATAAVLTTPSPGGTLTASSVTFGWTAGVNVTGYALWIGNSPTDADNLYYSGEKAPTVTSLTVNGLPTNGETIYVRLITYYGSSSAYTNYTYTAE
jgi:uncharacterized repeat protein (TIGR03803 family)